MGTLRFLTGLIAKWASTRAVYAWGFRASLTSVPLLPYLPFEFLNQHDRLLRIQGFFFLAILLFLFITYQKYLLKLVKYAFSNPTQGLVLALMYLMVSGLIGAGLGIPALIWNEEPWSRFFSAMGATLVLAVIGISAYYLIPIEGPDGELYQDRVMDDIERFLEYWHVPPPRTIGGWARALLRNPLGAVLLDWTDWLPEDASKGRFLFYATYPLRIFRTPDPTHESAHRLSRFLRFARLPFLVLLVLPALLPAFYSQLPQYAPVVKDVQTGELHDRVMLKGRQSW